MPPDFAKPSWRHWRLCREKTRNTRNVRNLRAKLKKSPRSKGSTKPHAVSGRRRSHNIHSTTCAQPDGEVAASHILRRLEPETSLVSHSNRPLAVSNRTKSTRDRARQRATQFHQTAVPGNK